MINTQNIAELSEKVAYIEAALKTAGIELPSVTEDDNGKTLQVVAGKWDKGIVIPELPAVTGSDNNNVLEVVNGAWSKNKVITKVSEIVATATNTQVSPFGAYGSLDISSYIRANGTLIAVKAKANSANPAYCMIADNNDNLSIVILERIS